MKKTKIGPAAGNPVNGDTEAMVRALSALNDAGVRFFRPSRYQLKVGSLNYYPDRGTIYADGADHAEEQRGIEALIARIKDSPERRKRDHSSTYNRLNLRSFDASLSTSWSENLRKR